MSNELEKAQGMKNLLFTLAKACRFMPRSVRMFLLWRLDGIRYMREVLKIGKIGERCRIYSRLFGSEPYLIEIGNHVHIGENVQLITHDGGVWVLRDMLERQELDSFGKIVIKDNVFIGNNTIILPGVVIGENVVIGAGSVVTKDVPHNTVVGGVPAKTIKSIELYAKKVDQCLETKHLIGMAREKVIREHFNHTL
jgi:acetyltransferase-like isoleucine patch superfamily enzyme